MKDLHGVYSRVELYVLIFSLKDNNQIMKCSFKKGPALVLFAAKNNWLNSGEKKDDQF